MVHPENSEEYKGLIVNKGIEQPSSVNPYLKRTKKRHLSVGDYVEGIIKGDVTTLSRAVTLVESVRTEHQVIAQEVIEKCLPYAGNSVRIGISGVPGAGRVHRSMYSDCMCSSKVESWLYWPLTPAVSGAKVVFWAIKLAWRNSRYIPTPLFVPVRRQVHWVV